MVHHIFGFQLENLGGFFHTAILFAIAGLFFPFAAGMRRWGSLLPAAIGHIPPFFCGAGILDGEKRNDRLPLAVAINLMHTYPDRGGRQGGYPKPGKRFSCTRRHRKSHSGDAKSLGVNSRATSLRLRRQKACCKNITESLKRQNPLDSLEGVCKVDGKKR